MPSGFRIATAYVTVEPDATGFADKLKAEVGDASVRVKLDTLAADAQIDDLKAKLADIGNPNVTPIINPAAGSPVVKIDADTTDADLKLDDLKARIDATSAMIRVGLDPADADARIQALQARLAGLAANTPVVTPRVDIADADAKIAALQAQLDSLKSETVSPKVNSSGLNEASKAAENTTGWMGLLIAAAATIAPVFITAGAGAALFGAAAAPALAKVAAYQQALNTKTASGQAQAQAMWATMTSGERQAAEGYATLGQAYKSLTASVQPQVITDVSIAVGQAARILPEFTGAAQAGGVAIGDLLTQFGDFLQSPQTKGFLSFVSQEAGPDLHALGTVLSGASGAVFGLTEDLNPLAKALTTAAGGVLGFVGDVARGAPGLVEFAGAATLAGFALVKLGEGFTAIKTSAAVTGITEFISGARTLAGVEAVLAAMQTEQGLAEVNLIGPTAALAAAVDDLTVSESALAAASVAVDIVSPWMWAVAAAAAVGALTFAVYKLTTGGESLTQQLVAQYNATGYNVAGYEHVAAALDHVAVSQDKVTAGGKYAIEASHEQAQATTQAGQAYLTQAQNINSALNRIQAMYGLTRAGAIQLAEGVKGSAAAFGQGGKAAQGMMEKVQGYAIQGAQAASVTTQLAVDMATAADDAQSLTARVKALSDAYNALVSPLTSVIGDTVTWKNDNVSLASALQASGDRTGYVTAAQRAASQAMAASVNDTLNLSEATLQNTGSATKAAAILRQEIGVLEQVGAKGSVAAALLARLKAALDALHSKTIQVNVDVAQYGGVNIPAGGGRGFTVPAAAGAVIPGYAPGRDTVPVMASPGESILVPELTRAIGPERIMAANAAYSRGRSRGNKTGRFAGGGVVDSLFSAPNYDQFNVYLNVAGATDPSATAAVVKGLKTPAAVKSFGQTGQALADAFASGSLKTLSQIKSEASQLISDVQKYYSGAAQKRLVDALSRQATALEHLAGQRTDIDKRLAAEKSYASGISGSLAGYSDLSNLTAPVTGESNSALASSLHSQLQAKLATLRKFFVLIGDLKRHGVSKVMIAQVVALGPDEGVQYAQAILSGGGKLISELNSEESRIGALDTSIGRRATEVQYGQSISAGFLSGLKRQRAELDREMARLGDQLAREVAKDFDLPLKDVRGLGGHHRHGRHHGGHGQGAGPAITINYYGTQHPNSEQKAAMMRDLTLALSGATS